MQTNRKSSRKQNTIDYSLFNKGLGKITPGDKMSKTVELRDELRCDVTTSSASARKKLAGEQQQQTVFLPKNSPSEKAGEMNFDREKSFGRESGAMKEEDDWEMEEMMREMAELKEEEARITKQLEIKKVRDELEQQRKKVKQLRGTPKTSSSVRIAKHEYVHDVDRVCVDDLRSDENLQRLVQKELKNLGLQSYLNTGVSSSASSESSTESDDSIESERRCKKKKSKKHKKSGINAKASDRVKYPQHWPHAHLQFEYVNKQLKFEDLDFKMFIAGELVVITREDLSAIEKNGRLEFLKKLVYYSNTYEFVGLKSFYAAWLREIELGKKCWTDDPQQIENIILSKFLLKSKNSTYSSYKKDIPNKNTDEDLLWFCSEYQRNKCQHKSNHLVVIKGKQRLATHVCASCWLKDKKKLEHPESSSCCPHLAK